jgi:hypothetical protein
VKFDVHSAVTACGLVDALPKCWRNPGGVGNMCPETSYTSNTLRDVVFESALIFKYVDVELYNVCERGGGVI